jgi:hypothetical protein
MAARSCDALVLSRTAAMLAWGVVVVVSFGGAILLAVGPPSPTVDAPPAPTEASQSRELDDQRPPSPTITPELRRSTDRDQPTRGGGVRDDVLGDRAVDQIQVRVRDDGSVIVDVPRSVRMRAAGCTLGRCLGRRKIDRQSDKPIPLATAPVMLGLSGTFGWTPPSPRDATRFLDLTREQRLKQTVASQRRMLEKSSGEVSVRLAALLHDHSLSPARRRSIVFQLWDDATCSALAVDHDDPLAPERARAAKQARDRIERFVRQWLPRGSALGYSEAELARLNSSRCAPRAFRPYDAPASDTAAPK